MGVDELKEFFEKFGEVTEHMIMRDHTTSRSRGFGFVMFDTEEAVDELLTKGNKVDFAGAQVEIKQAEPKSSSTLPPRHFRDSRAGFGRGYIDVLEGASYGAGPYMAGGGYGGRDYDGFVGSQYNVGYGGYRLYRGDTQATVGTTIWVVLINRSEAMGIMLMMLALEFLVMEVQVAQLVCMEVGGLLEAMWMVIRGSIRIQGKSGQRSRPSSTVYLISTGCNMQLLSLALRSWMLG